MNLSNEQLITDAIVELVKQGQGGTLSGQLRAGSGGLGGAALCVFSTVVTDADREFLGLAMTGSGGAYRFEIGPGPSRHLGVAYRPDNRQIGAQATLLTRVRPTLRLRRKVVHNKGYATFSGWIPGPHNDNVVVVAQVESGKGWRAFRRYRTRSGGHYNFRYRFTQTHSRTIYVVRVQVRKTGSYPYLEGSSAGLPLRVMP